MLSAFLLQAYASVFVYYPASLYSQPVKPPLIFQPVSMANVSSSISSSGTSAQVNITIPITQVQLLQNPDFNMSSTELVYWSNYSSTTNLAWSVATVVSNDNYSARYSGSITKGNYTGRINQSVNVSGQPLNITISYQVPVLDQPISLSITFGLYNPARGWVCSNTTSPSSTTTWRTVPFVCTPTAGTYYAMLEIIATTKANATKSLKVDIDYFTITSTGGVFNGTVLQVYNQDSQPYYALLTLDATTSTYSNITSCNITLSNSAPIQIQNGQIVTSVTSEASVDPQSAVPINVDATVTNGTSTLNLTLRYCTLPGGNGACVSYPMNITLNSG